MANSPAIVATSTNMTAPYEMISVQVTATQITPVLLGCPAVRAMIGTLRAGSCDVLGHALTTPVSRWLVVTLECRLPIPHRTPGGRCGSRSV